MAVIGMDLGGTKLSSCVFSNEGIMLNETTVMLEGREGKEVGSLITGEALRLLSSQTDIRDRIISLGICVPGIYHGSSGKVWAPNIPGWDDFPLLEMLRNAFAEKNVAISIDSDRACSILGETWKGAAKNCRNAVFLAIGTGIGAGILCDGRIIRGHADIAGAAGWMALTPEYLQEYQSCGCLEYHTSGRGMVMAANELIRKGVAGTTPGKNTGGEKADAKGTGETPFFDDSRQVFEAFENNDPVAIRVLDDAIRFWGMAAANLVSIFNPEIIIFGGGVFGPASRFIKKIREEASGWAQPVSMQQVRFEVSTLGGGAGLAGAGKLALLAVQDPADTVIKRKL